MQRVILINQDPPEHTATRQIISRGFTPRSIGALEEIMTQRAREIVQDAVRAGHGQLRRGGRRRAAAAGDRRPDRRTAGGPAQALRLVQPDARLRRPRDRGRARRRRRRDPRLRDDDGRGPQGEPARRPRHQADQRRQGRPRAHRRRVRLLRDPADRGRQRDHPQRDHARHERVPRQPRPVGAVEARAPGDDGRRGRPLGHAGDASSSAPRSTTSRSAACRSRRASGRRCSTPAPTSTRTSSRTRSRFDITRDPNPHVGFGGHGAHYCIGANLARQEIRLIFDALADHAPDITKLEEPRRLRHAWINGIKDLQVKYA